MAADDLTGNMPTENLLSYFDENSIELGLDKNEFVKSMQMAIEVFPS